MSAPARCSRDRQHETTSLPFAVPHDKRAVNRFAALYMLTSVVGLPTMRGNRSLILCLISITLAGPALAQLDITYTTRTARAVWSPAVLVDGSLYLRYGAVIDSAETWTAVPADNVTQFQWLPNRVGVLAGGTLSPPYSLRQR